MLKLDTNWRQQILTLKRLSGKWDKMYPWHTIKHHALQLIYWICIVSFATFL